MCWNNKTVNKVSIKSAKIWRLILLHVISGFSSKPHRLSKSAIRWSTCTTLGWFVRHQISCLLLMVMIRRMRRSSRVTRKTRTMRDRSLCQNFFYTGWIKRFTAWSRFIKEINPVSWIKIKRKELAWAGNQVRVLQVLIEWFAFVLKHGWWFCLWHWR